MAPNDFQPVNPSQSELLRYHLTLTERVDKEIELKKAQRVVQQLTNPPVFEQHQHAQISHDEQKTRINENNQTIEKRVKKEQKTVTQEKKQAKAAAPVTEFKHLSAEEAEQSRKAMEAQIRNAANRKTETEGEAAPADKVAPVSGGITPAATTVAPVTPPWATGQQNP